MMAEWERDVRAWRCGLTSAEVVRLRGTTAGWNCADVVFHVGRVSFDDAGPELKARLSWRLNRGASPSTAPSQRRISIMHNRTIAPQFELLGAAFHGVPHPIDGQGR